MKQASAINSALPAGSSTTAAVSPASRRILKILEISTSGTIGTRDMGPVSATISALADGFQTAGHRVTIVDAPSPHSLSQLESGAEIVRVGPSSKWVRLAERLPPKIRPIYSWICAAIYVRSLRKKALPEEFDVVHAHDPWLAFCLALQKARFHYTSHTSLWALQLEQGRPLRIGHRFEKWIESFAMRRAVGVIALSDYLTRHAPRANVAVIHHGIDLERWTPLDRTACRTALGLERDAFIALFVGRVHPQKGVDILIEAVRKLAPSTSRLNVVVLGPLGGEFHQRTQPSHYAQQLMQRARGLPIRFLGFIGNESTEFRQWLAAADVAVFPSRFEPFGYVALEALAMSLPVIASRTGGLAKTISDEVGYLAPPEDPDALAAAIRAAHDHPEQLARRRANCRARVIAEYTRGLFIERHLLLFQQSSTIVREAP